MIGHEDAVECAVYDRLEQWVALISGGKFHDTGSRSEKCEHADRAEHGQQDQDIGLDIIPVHVDEAAGSRNQDRRNQQHRGDGTAAWRTLALIVSLALVGVSRLRRRCRIMTYHRS